MATEEMTIKLMVDTESNRLIFAEASKDFIDFLIFLLSLPIGTVIKLLTSESMVGSIGNVYTSVSKLDETYLRPNVNKNVILNPMVFSSVTNVPLSATTNGSSINSSWKFYTCCDPKCKRGITNVLNGAHCPGCYGIMNQEMEFIDKDSEGYVQNAASYMISDDLSITSVSSMSIVSMMNKFNAYKLEERKVKVGTREALELLKASFQSTTVLTDVFLRAKNGRRARSIQNVKRCEHESKPRRSEGQSASQPPRSDNFYLSPQAPFIPTQQMQYPQNGLFTQWLSTPPSNLQFQPHPNPCAAFSGPTPSQDPPYHHQHPHSQQNAPPPVVSCGSKNWTSKEDLQLCRAWVNVFEGKRKDKMWERVKETLHQLMKEAYGEESVRNVGACINRMRDVKAQCNKWEDIRTRAFQRPANDLDLVDLESLAMETWEDENNGKPFRYMACWKVLKECSKWNEPVKKSSGKSTGSTSQTCVGAPYEPLDTPLPEFAPVHTASNRDKSQTPITPKTEEDSPGRISGLTEKGATCTPILNGPASRDIDSPPSQKRAKGQKGQIKQQLSDA